MTIKKNIQVSVVIVCMNNLQNLYPCLDSIRKYTTVSYEVLVVAYLFSKDNLKKLRDDYPWVILIESNEIRGFSENNNLALRQVNGEYCFIVNDDTEIKMPVIDSLFHSFRYCPDNTAIVSPVILNHRGDIAFCGRPPITRKHFILRTFHLWNESKSSKYSNKKGLFRSYNILGAAFMIKTDIFKKIGFFDEYYFFCPEDIALSTALNKNGYFCYVNADVSIIHYEGMSNKSISYIQTATMPASRQGGIRFYSGDNLFVEFVLRFITFIGLLLNFIVHRIKGLSAPRPNSYYVLSVGDWNTLINSFSRKTPKQLFKKYYYRLNSESHAKNSTYSN